MDAPPSLTDHQLVVARCLEQEDMYGDALVDIPNVVVLVDMAGPTPLFHCMSWYDLRATLEQPATPPRDRVRLWRSDPLPSNYVYRVLGRWFDPLLEPFSRHYNTLLICDSYEASIGTEYGLSTLHGAIERLHRVHPIHRRDVIGYLRGDVDIVAFRARLATSAHAPASFTPLPDDAVLPAAHYSERQVVMAHAPAGRPSGYGRVWRQGCPDATTIYNGERMEEVIAASENKGGGTAEPASTAPASTAPASTPTSSLYLLDDDFECDLEMLCCHLADGLLDFELPGDTSPYRILRDHDHRHHVYRYNRLASCFVALREWPAVVQRLLERTAPVGVRWLDYRSYLVSDGRWYLLQNTEDVVCEWRYYSLQTGDQVYPFGHRAWQVWRYGQFEDYATMTDGQRYGSSLYIDLPRYPSFTVRYAGMDVPLEARVAGNGRLHWSAGNSVAYNAFDARVVPAPSLLAAYYLLSLVDATYDVHMLADLPTTWEVLTQWMRDRYPAATRNAAYMALLQQQYSERMG